MVYGLQFKGRAVLHTKEGWRRESLGGVRRLSTNPQQ
jgi:hypothetical protein